MAQVDLKKIIPSSHTDRVVLSAVTRTVINNYPWLLDNEPGVSGSWHVAFGRLVGAYGISDEEVADIIMLEAETMRLAKIEKEKRWQLDVEDVGSFTQEIAWNAAKYIGRFRR